MHIGFDIGGSGIRAASTAELQRGEIARWSWDTPTLDEIVERIVGAASERSATRLGIGVPGQVVDGVVVEAPNLTALSGVDLRRTLSGRLGIDVRIDNDASLAALGVARTHGHRNLLLVTVGTGVGCGIVVDGRLVGGRAAGELGHVWCGGTQRCGCGATGCLETWCGAAGLTRRANHLGLAGGPATWSGDPGARPLWEHAGRALGRAVRGAIHLVGPDVVCVAGGLTAARAHWQPAFDAELERRLPVHAAVQVRWMGDAAAFVLHGALAT